MSSVCVATAHAARPTETGTGRPQGFILLVRTSGDEGAITRIRAELLASGWRIVELRRDERLESMSLAELAVSEGATAGIRINAEEAEIELWVARDDSKQGIFERIVASEPNADDAVLALRTTEALRARGLKVEPLPKSAESSEPKVKPPPPKRQSAKRTAARPAVSESIRRFSLEAAPGVVASPGGLDPTLSGWGSMRLSLLRNWSVAGILLAPISSQTIDGAEGSARVRTLLLGGASDLHVIQSGSWELSLGAGVAGCIVFMNGSAKAGFMSTRDTVLATAPFGQTSLHYSLSKHWNIFVRGLVGATFPEISVRFAEREVAHWGRPFAVAMLGLEFAPLLWTLPD